ncbi:hypothetical protein PO662_21305 [Klebsiella oxytoca]|uniref:tail fiber/spike domain-containing protein n=1 Tax=Klebsiella oxytoca TaxID=571 RepID=UPI00190E883E|nr:hypothetical protein [Klebsiella oxytoca]CAA0298915.1 Uncharacterised protein [Klebsiella oxytoca]HDX8848323.1 hypothetical protein [Klebsiella oxytoca]HEJ7551518.1 hypothetical protein [Klebsiella oxytoca]
MARIPESSLWEEEIELISRNERVSGGLDGVANRPLKSLTNRTRYLKDKADASGELIAEKVSAVKTFVEGTTLKSPREEILHDAYRLVWTGEFPKVVPVASSPETTGGVGAGRWAYTSDAVIRSGLASSDPLLGDSLVMHHTGKTVAEYLDLYLATVFLITPEQYGAKGDTVQDDSDALEDAINKAVATSLMSGGVYTPVVVQLNKPYRITRTITIDASRVRLNAISGCGVYVDPDGTYTDNKVFNITGSGPNAAVAASKVGALFDGVLFLTNGEKKLDLFHAVRDSTASNDNGACLHNVSNIAARGFRTIFTHGAGGWGWNFTGCLFSGNINLMDIITAGDTYERHTFVGCLWGNGGYAFKMNNPNGKIYWIGGSVDYCDGLAQITSGHMEVNGHNEWTGRTKPLVEITGSNASLTVSGAIFVRGNTDTQYYMFQQYQKRQVTLKDTVFITDGVNVSKGLISNLEVVKSNLTFPNDAAKSIAYNSSDESLLTSNNAVVDFSLSAAANHTVSMTDGKLTVTAVTGGTTSHLYIDIPVMGNTKVGFKLVASNTSSLGAISLNKSLLTLSKRQISDLSASGTASWPASAASIAGGSVTLFDIPRQAAFLRLDFNVANLTTGASFIIESLKMFTY